MSNLIVILFFSILFVAITFAEKYTRTRPESVLSTISPNAHSNLKPELSPKSNHNFNRNPNAKFGLPRRAKPPSPQKSKPKRIATSPEQSKPKSKKNATSPYQFANRFCLSRRLDVKTTFCLQVLRSGPTTEATDSQALLGISADVAIGFGNKTVSLLKNLSAEKKPESKAALTECISAYEGYLKQFQNLLLEAQIQAQLAGYDSELAKLEIGRCVKALKKAKNDEIKVANKVALDHASLAQSIADAIVQ